MILAESEGPDQTAQMRRLIWAFAVRICLHMPEDMFSHGEAYLTIPVLSRHILNKSKDYRLASHRYTNSMV